VSESTATRREALLDVGRWWALVGGLRGVMVGALPGVITVVSPNRVTLSILIAAFYVVVALVIVRPRTIGRPLFIYAVVAAVFVALALLRMETIDPLNAAQREYGFSKASFFLEAVLPLSFAAAVLVSSLDDMRPAAVVFLIFGVLVALPTVVLLNQSLFGATRYTTQGNYIAIAGLLLAQFWLVRDLRIVIPLVLLCFAGVLVTQSRQSVAAVAIGLLVTGVYWFAADRVGAAAGKPSALKRMLLLPGVIYGSVVAVVAIWALLVLQVWIPLPHAIRDPVTCNCIAGRFIDLTIHPGGRNVLVEQGWALFVSHPIFGAGLGAYVGLAPSQYPHNIPLEVAGEMGLIGVLILLAPLLVASIRLVVGGIRSASPAAAGVLMILLVYVVAANLSGDLASERGLWVFGFIVLKLGFDTRSAVMNQ
jgi:O-antigen ligase